MQDEQEILNESEPQVSLKDVTEEGADPAEKPPHKGGKKKLIMIGALLLLLVLTTAGGWFLLRGRQVKLKATPRAVEKVTSGRDLQKAAYDSLSGSLTGKATDILPGTTTTGSNSGQGANVVTPTVTPSPSASPAGSLPKVPAPIQPGMAMTLAPPPEAMMTRPGENRERPAGRRPEPGGQQVSAAGATATSGTVSRPRTDASILFTLLPGKASEKSRTEIKPAAVAGKALAEIRSSQISEQRDNKPVLRKSTALPGFGAMLPVRLLGVLYTLRPGSMVRLELLREVRTEQWSLKRGTLLVGSVAGSDLDRAYVQIRGFIDPETKSVIQMTGEVLGSDGGAGLRGRKRRISSIWARVLDRAAQSGTQILSSVLGRQGSAVVIATDPYGTYHSATATDQSERQNTRSFVEVPAGAVGFVMVTTLPPSSQPDAHPAISGTGDEPGSSDLSDAELAELFAEADPARIRTALPRLNPALRRIAEMTLREIEGKDH